MSFLHNPAPFPIVGDWAVGGGTRLHNVTSGLDKANPCSASSKIYKHENPETGRSRSRKGNLVDAGGPALIVQETMTLIPKE